MGTDKVSQVDLWELAAFTNTSYNTMESRIRKRLKPEVEALIQKTKEEGRIDDSGEVVKAMLPSASGTRGGKGAKKDPASGESSYLSILHVLRPGTN